VPHAAIVQSIGPDGAAIGARAARQLDLCVAMLPAERGKALGAHVTAAALRAAQRIGYRVGILQSSPEGHSIYLRLGFADLGAMPMFVGVPLDPAASAGLASSSSQRLAGPVPGNATGNEAASRVNWGGE